jgi:hypothetical protein
MYYLRTKSAADALTGLGIDMSKYKSVEAKVEPTAVQTPVPVTPTPVQRRDEPEMIMSSEDLAKLAEKMEADIVCSLDNPEDCLSCGS